MKYSMKNIVIAGVALFIPSLALAAPGLLNGTEESMSPEAIEALQTDIAEARVSNEAHFTAVARIVREAGELDGRKRGPMAPFPAMFKRLGAKAHLAMLEVLLVEGPARGTLKDTAWHGLRAGLIEAAGKQRDSRLVAPLAAVLNGPETEHYLIRASAEALGRVNSDEAAAILIAAAQNGGLKKGSIWAGMGTCRRAAVAKYLAAELDAATSPEAKKVLAKSLSTIANEYAWKTSHVQVHAAELMAVRESAAKALFTLYREEDTSELGETALKALVVVGHPETRTWIEAGLTDAPQATRASLERLQARLR